MVYIFGPVPSRRLGLSLGVDLIPSKTCSYDCLYCQIGKTTCKTLETEKYVPIDQVKFQLEQTIEKTRPDTVTIAGSGEPTLNSQLGEIIAFIKSLTEIRVAILTNGSLLWKEEVRNRVLDADIITPTLSTGFDETFQAIHRPHPDLDLSIIIEGLKTLRKCYKGNFLLEVILLAGYNDNEKELEKLKEVIDEISPDKIQLNTVVRPPSDSRAASLNEQQLESIKNYFGENAEIIADSSSEQKGAEYESLSSTVLEMAKRRPVSGFDIERILDIGVEEVEGILKGLLMKGKIKKRKHQGEDYYIVE
ncbi:radical SAM protein [Thermodesulfobacteriota bacterium]